MTDRKVIYLDDAIDALAYFTEKSPTGRTAQEVVKDLPSAQPSSSCVHENDSISRQAAIDALDKIFDSIPMEQTVEVLQLRRDLRELPPAQSDVPDINVGDINKFIDGLEEIFADIRERHVDDSVCGLCEYDGAYMGQSGDWCNECPGFDRDDCFKLSNKCRKKWIDAIAKAQPEPLTEIDAVKREDVVDILHRIMQGCSESEENLIGDIVSQVDLLPPAQRTCVNCGRTVNNGGWYADGRTRCPIEEHYALPKDGYCHLWEKRNVTDDDYPERQKNEQV